MRVLVVSALYPPVAFGGYEVECSAVADRLAEKHQVLVLTGDRERATARSADAARRQVDVRRDLASLTADESGALRAPLASLRAVGTARRALAWAPDLIYAWNGASIPQASLRVLADSGVPLAFRVCEHWFGGLFRRDQFMRELLPQRRGVARAAWATGCRLLNRLPALRLNVTAPVRTAVSWNSQAIKNMIELPPFIEVALERVDHSVPRFGDVYATVTRKPAEQAEIAFVGRVTPYKGVDVAIEALALLHSDYQIPATLTVAGPVDGDYSSQLRELASRLGVADALRWPGSLPPESIAALLARASAMIVPSTWDEPFPLVTIEAALARVPIVASDVGGISEGVADEEHALLFPRSDARAAAGALARVLSETERTSARVARAYDRAQAFRLGPYLDSQERFVFDALAALRGDDRPA
ncbi:MAG TPA: glycosyltransferase family 4 protein [Solirubrobacteraceae bacterium]|nr:glycosyltransferase family 4 protein [Solirubrobacteraceae bacterium]